MADSLSFSSFSSTMSGGNDLGADGGRNLDDVEVNAIAAGYNLVSKRYLAAVAAA